MPEWLTPLIVGLAIGAGLVGLLVWLFRQQLRDAREDFEKLREKLSVAEKSEADARARADESEKRRAEGKALLEETQKTSLEAFQAIAEKALKENKGEFLALTDQKIQPLNQHLEKIAKLIKEFEGDRDRKYGALTSEIKRTSEVASKLQKSTDHLNEVLSNPTARGNWGEKMVEDILQLVGLEEGANYLKQTSQDGKRPDYTFLLPNEMKINMDVKFPLDNYVRFCETQEEAHKEEFLKNVKTMIDDVTKGKNYIDPASGTLDFVLIFIPNEAVYQFIHQEGRELLKRAEKQKAVLCGPWMLYAMLKIIRQATDVFNIEQGTREILNYIQEFHKQWQKYLQEFEKLGENLETTRRKYEEVAGRRSRALDRIINKIEAEQGQSQLMDASEEPADSQETQPE